MMKLSLSILLVLTLFGTVSCIDYTEEFTIKANGSGTIHSIISMKKGLAKDDPGKLKNDLERMFANGEGLSLANYTVRSEKDRRITDFTIAFDQVEDLKSALAGGGAKIAQYFGAFEAKEEKDRFLMKRTIDLSGENKEGGGLKKLLTGALLKDSHLTYRMCFPLKILASNSKAIEAETNTVEWKFSVAEAVQGPLKMTVEISKPPLLKWLTTGFGVLAAIIAGTFFFFKRRHRQS